MINLSYKYSTLDKQHQFSVDFIGSDGVSFNSIWTQWVFYGIGQEWVRSGMDKWCDSKSIKPALFPYTPWSGKFKKVKSWKGNTYNATIYGKLIVRCMFKKLMKVVKDSKANG